MRTMILLLMLMQALKMHQLDPILKSLDSELETADTAEDIASLKKQIKEREDTLMPMYLQVSDSDTSVCARQQYYTM